MTPKAKRQPNLSAGNRRKISTAARRPARVWQMTSGNKLSEFALGSGFLAPQLLGPQLNDKRHKAASREDQVG